MTKAVILIGLGREAEAAAHYFVGAAPLFVYDDDPPKAERFAAAHSAIALDAEGVAAKAAGALILRAPGAPPRHPLLTPLREAGDELTTYLGYWLSQHRNAVLATITGSKGKSTTTSLCGLILQHAGLDVSVGGNIGIVPTAPPTGERWVFETSSYQLHDIPAAAPVHAITSLYPEHLDWHGGFENYFAAKQRPLVIDPSCIGIIARDVFARLPALPNTLYVAEDIVRIEPSALALGFSGETARIALNTATEARLKAEPLLAHNLSMALATAIATGAAPLEALGRGAAQAAESWASLPSRQKPIGEYAGRLWVDDALATIPQATIAALRRWENRPARLILGGRNREQDFSSMIEYVNARADVTVYAYGESARRFAPLLKRIAHCTSMDEALTAAFDASAPGDLILFSPAGATSERGATYEDRARRFAEFAKAVS
jgi:UDP-N-acetylmuramoyl-L-alanine---L-glutamate ligase